MPDLESDHAVLPLKARHHPLPRRSPPRALRADHEAGYPPGPGHADRRPVADGTKTAVFGLGCFWGDEKDFWQLPGVVTTAVGYAGGHTPNPTYQEVCSERTGHAEVVLVAYDPSRISYERLLKTFWESHDPTQGMRQGNDMGTSYRSIIIVADDEQRAAAEASKAMFQEELSAGGTADHDRDRRCVCLPVLLRRGLPPAVP